MTDFYYRADEEQMEIVELGPCEQRPPDLLGKLVFDNWYDARDRLIQVINMRLKDIDRLKKKREELSQMRP